MEDNISEIRRECRHLISGYADYLGLSKAKILDVGIAGDPRPGENFKWFGGNDNTYETLDVDPIWNPTFVGDLCAAPFPDNSFDLVIVSNVLEHIFDFEKAIQEAARISKKYVILDCPWMFPYHPEQDGSFDDYWRISKTALTKVIKKYGLCPITSSQTKLITSFLCQKESQS